MILCLALSSFKTFLIESIVGLPRASVWLFHAPLELPIIAIYVNGLGLSTIALDFLGMLRNIALWVCLSDDDPDFRQPFT